MKYKVILYNDDGNILMTFEGVDDAKIYDDGDINLEIKKGLEIERMTGLKLNARLIPDEVDVGETMTDEILDQSTEIPRERTQEDKIEKMEKHFNDIAKVVNEVSRQFINSDNLSGEQKAELVKQFRSIKKGDEVDPGEVVNIGGELYEMIQPSPITIHDEAWLQDESLFAKFINPTIDDDGDEVVVVDDYQQPTGGHDAYNTGDMVTFEGEVYTALQDGLVWSPAEYPQGWQAEQ